MSEPIRIAIVDDQQLIRLGFRLVLEAESDFDVVGEADDGFAGVELVMLEQPDVVLMDVRMPGLDGITATKRIIEAGGQTKVIVLTTFDLDEYAFGALRAGASGFLLKDAQRSELTGAIRAVHRGDAALAPRITRAVIDLVTATTAPTQNSDIAGRDHKLSQLTERELDCFTMISKGYSNQEIANALFLSESTVKTHVGRVLAKLGARDRVAAVIMAAGWGLAGT